MVSALDSVLNVSNKYGLCPVSFLVFECFLIRRWSFYCGAVFETYYDNECE